METLAYYTLELARPPGGWSKMPEITARARHASDELRREGTQVRFLRSIFVPEDDVCLYLYRAASTQAVREAASRAALSVRKVTETLQPVETDPG